MLHFFSEKVYVYFADAFTHIKVGILVIIVKTLRDFQGSTLILVFFLRK